MVTSTAKHPVASDEFSQRLKYYLNMDFWAPREAALLFLGIDPNWSTLGIEYFSPEADGVIVRLDGQDLSEDLQARQGYEDQYLEIMGLWERTRHDIPPEETTVSMTSGTGTSTAFPVSYLIEWAWRKNIEVDWLPWASANNLVSAATLPTGFSENPTEIGKESSRNAQPSHPARNVEHPFYAPELHAVLEAWEALYVNGEKPDNVDHTTAATTWFKKHWPQFGPTAIKRLTPVINTKDNKNSGRFEEK